MSNGNQPAILSKARDHLNDLADEFKDNIRKIAIRIARHERAVYVNPRHFDEAKDCLNRTGLNRRSFWSRPELEVGAGTTLLSLTLSVPDMVAITKVAPDDQKTVS